MKRKICGWLLFLLAMLPVSAVSVRAAVADSGVNTATNHQTSMQG